jgi:DNA replication and repair protein RecF
LKSSSPRWREIAAFDELLLAAGQRVAEARARFFKELQPEAEAAHHAISGAREKLRIEYARSGGEDFPAALEAARKEDSRLRQTSVGPHRDDAKLLLNDQPAELGSEGQQRTLVLALKLGAARLLQRHYETPPVLLLDDTFGELDLTRRAALLATLPAEAQKLVTTTHLDWLPEGLEERVLEIG